MLGAIGRTYQNHRSWCNDYSAALGLALFVAGAVRSLPGYPLEWLNALPLLVALVGLKGSRWSYLAAIGALCWPLFLISVYVMALWLALTILPIGPAVRHIHAVLLVALTPILSNFHLEFVPLLLAAILWGQRAGLWTGLLSAFWLKIFSAAYGHATLDLTSLALQGFGSNFGHTQLETFLHDRSSLETLTLLAKPFMLSPGIMLENCVQIGILGLAGYVAGTLSQKAWTKDIDWLIEAGHYFRFVVLRGALLPLGAATLLIIFGLTYAPLILTMHDLAGWGLRQSYLLPLTREVGGALVIAGLLYLILFALQQPTAADSDAKRKPLWWSKGEFNKLQGSQKSPHVSSSPRLKGSPQSAGSKPSLRGVGNIPREEEPIIAIELD